MNSGGGTPTSTSGLESVSRIIQFSKLKNFVFGGGGNDDDSPLPSGIAQSIKKQESVSFTG